jgi:hypothetical protein
MRTEVDDTIDAMKDGLTGEQMNKAINPNAISARIRRKNTRYNLYSLKNATISGNVLDISDDFKSIYTMQDGFDGWSNFAITWDVALDQPEKVVSRRFSDEEEWERTVQAKFPQVQADGSIKYPDLKVERAVKEEATRQAKAKAKKKDK